MLSPRRLHSSFAIAMLAVLTTDCLGQSTQDPGGTSPSCGEAGSGGTGALPCSCGNAETVTFHDPAFERGVLNSLERYEGPVTLSEAKEASHITVVGATSLDDVECLPSLVMLRLDGGSVEDLSLLSGLSELAVLHLIGLPAHDLSPLENKTLTSLSVIDTPVSDLTTLGAMNSLVDVVLQKTKVSDISLLGRQPQLTLLDLSESPVSELAALAGHESLSRVRIDGTKVTDLTPLGDPSFVVSCPLVSALDIAVDAAGPTGAAELCEAGWGVTWSSVGGTPIEVCHCGSPD